jgi:hypothetical protein
MAHRGAVGGLDHLYALGPQRALGKRGLHQFPQREVGVQRLGTATRDAGVAALDGQRSGLDGDVRAALEDRAEDPQPHPHLPNADAARAAAGR